MVKLRYGTQGQVSFSDLTEYYYALGFLANSRNAELRWENNEDQGAWGSEGRIHCLVPENRFPQCFRFTAGRGAVYARINCNDYVGTLVMEHNFKANSKTQNLTAIMETVPEKYREAFKEGYGGGITVNPAYKEKTIVSRNSKTNVPATAVEKESKIVEKKQPIVVKKGQIVVHKTFGEGTVISNGEYIKISFPKLGEKTFSNPGAFDMGFLKL